MDFFSCAMERLYALASDLPPDLLVLLTACNYLISALRDSMVECFLAFVFVRNLVLVTNTPGISWLLVAASVMFYIYVSTCDSMSVVVEVAALAGAWLMVLAVCALPKDTPRLLFVLSARFVAA